MKTRLMKRNRAPARNRHSRLNTVKPSDYSVKNQRLLIRDILNPAHTQTGQSAKTSDDNYESESERAGTGTVVLPYPGVYLRFGSRGDHVRTLQSLLNSHGHDLDVDGIVGPLTHSAILRFQQSQGLAVDGIVGPITWQALTTGGDEHDKPQPATDEVVSQKDCQLLATALQTAGQSTSLLNPASAELIMPAIQAIAAQILFPVSGQTQTAGFMPITGNVSQQVSAPAQTVEGIKAGLSRLLDFVAKDMGSYPFSGQPGDPDDPVRWQAQFLDFIDLQVSNLIYQEWPLGKVGVHSLSTEELNMFQNRVRNMRGFYNSLLPAPMYISPPPAGAEMPGEMPTQKRPTDPARLRLVGYALADLGKVKAMENDSNKDRFGHQYLKHIFDTAWPNHGLLPIVFKRRIPGLKQRHKNKPDDPDEYYMSNDALPSWCGVGATFWARKAFSDFPTWIQPSVVYLLQKRLTTELPEVGDIVASTTQGHHGIVSWVDPKATPPKDDNEWKQIKIRTVEANIDGKIVTTRPSHATLAYWNVGVFKPYKK